MSLETDPGPPRHPLLACLSLAAFLLAACVAAAVLWWFWPWGGTGLNPNAQARTIAPRANLSDQEKANIEIYEQASPCLVQVTNLAARSIGFGLEVQEVPKGVGSGFVWDHDGHIVTNYHVVQGAAAAHVTLADHSTYDTRQISAYPDQDIAVLWVKAPRSRLHPVSVGTSHDLKVGQIVYTLGDPYGLDQSMSNGIVSALGREIHSVNGRVIRGVIQSTAAINPGNSGGPLLDSAGRLIGMNTAIVSQSGAFAGIGFSIPVDEINQIVPQLIRHGKVVRPRLGVQVASDQLARRLGIKRGALIVRVTPGSPAAQAGLQGLERDEEGHIHLGDIIVAMDGKQIDNMNDLYEALEHHRVGDTVTLTIVREGERQDLQVTLQEGE
jgi:S1-C subfamily serine protease